jgi:uncharacterized membrane protein
MILSPLLAAPLSVQCHTAAALAALLVGVLQWVLPKGGPRHRLFGWLWIGLMVAVSVSSFAIRVLLPTSPLWGLSPIHLLSVWTLYAMAMGLRQLYRGNVDGHRRWMVNTFLFALIGAGVFTLWPGRLLHRVFF